MKKWLSRVLFLLNHFPFLADYRSSDFSFAQIHSRVQSSAEQTMHSFPHFTFFPYLLFKVQVTRLTLTSRFPAVFVQDALRNVVAGEILGTSEKVEVYFDKLLERSAGIHGRVSSGEQVQVDVGLDGDHPMMEHFTRWWRKGMAHWLKQAQPGDLFPFCSELGPPNYYGITRRDEHGQEHEVSDRWQQALLLKRIIKEQWKKAQDELY